MTCKCRRYCRLAALFLVTACASACGNGRTEPRTAAPDQRSAPGRPRGPGAGPAAFPVEVATVEAPNVQYGTTAVGSVEAFERVQVTARVAGVVERVRFREGDVVTVAQVLVEIEPRRYAVAVAAARATLERAEAAKADADAGAARRERALAESPGLLAPEELETWHTKARLASADVAQARALLDQSMLNSRDSRVRAPVAGTIKRAPFRPGSIFSPAPS